MLLEAVGDSLKPGITNSRSVILPKASSPFYLVGLDKSRLSWAEDPVVYILVKAGVFRAMVTAGTLDFIESHVHLQILF